MAFIRPATAFLFCLIILGSSSLLPQQKETDRLVTSEYKPLTGQQRVKIYVKSTYYPIPILRAAANAGVQQWENYPRQWGQGGEGYGRRFGNQFGQLALRHTLIDSTATILHEDNRYFGSGESGFWPRTRFAIVHSFLARRDDGTFRFATSRVIGIYSTAFISRSWQPRRLNGPDNAILSGTSFFGGEIGYNVLREFGPDIKRKLHINR